MAEPSDLEEQLKACLHRARSTLDTTERFGKPGCKICILVVAESSDINRRLLTDESPTSICERYNLALPELLNHFQRHVKPALDPNRQRRRAPGDPDLAVAAKARAARKFPVDNYQKQLEFVAHDLLYARQIYFSEDKFNVRGIMQVSSALLKVMYTLEKLRQGEQKKLPPPKEASDEIDEELLSAENQAAIDEGRRKNQEAIDAAIRDTREDGLPRLGRGKTWLPSDVPTGPGIRIPEYKDINGGARGSGAEVEEDSPDPEGERPPRPIERIA